MNEGSILFILFILPCPRPTRVACAPGERVSVYSQPTRRSASRKVPEFPQRVRICIDFLCDIGEGGQCVAGVLQVCDVHRIPLSTSRSYSPHTRTLRHTVAVELSLKVSAPGALSSYVLNTNDIR